MSEQDPSEYVTPPTSDASTSPAAVVPPAAPAPPVPPTGYMPPHPYAAAAKPAGNGMSIAAMALGLASLLTVAVGFYATAVFGLTAVLFGLTALVLGIIALVRRQRNRGYALTGIVSGAIGGLATIALALYLVIVALSPGWSGGFGDETEGPSEAHQQPEPTALNFDGDWPANYADGGVTFDESLMPVLSNPLSAGDVPNTPATQRADGPADIQIFVDYRCPSCLDFEETNSETLEGIVESGEATLQVRPLTFLDRASQTAYSSRAAGTIACLAEEQPEHAWTAHKTLLSTGVQPAEGAPDLDNAGLISAIERTAGPINAEARSCIETGTFVSFAQAFTEWTFQNPVPNAIDPALTVAGTPFVIVNGEPFAGPNDDPAAFRTFLTEHGITLP